VRRTYGRVGPQGSKAGFGSTASFVVMALVAGLLAGCRHDPKPEPKTDPKSASKTDPNPVKEDVALTLLPPPDGASAVSKSIDLHFYLDSSGSMKNFLVAAKPGQTNYFTRVLNKAGDILSESWNANVSFWRFGDGEPRQLDGDGLSKFLVPAAFTDKSTHIEKAIADKTHATGEPSGVDRHQVKVILTDLFQDKDGAGKLAVLLDEAYLNQESMAVGVLGVRSAFHGKPDLPGHPDPDAADSMPFYFLISGQAPDVRFAIKHLVEDLKIADQDYFKIVFTQRPVEHLVHNLKVNAVGITQDDRPVPGSRNRFPVLTRVRKDVKVSMEEPPEEQKVNLGPHIKLGVHPKVMAVAFRRGQGSPDSKAQEGLTLALNEEPRQITIHRSALDANTMYRFQIDLMEDWEQPLANLDPWNLESPQDLVNDRYPEDAKGGRPGRTLSLRHFLNVLRLKMSQHETPLARYYIYVQTN
jgi:hypothetical protein